MMKKIIQASAAVLIAVFLAYPVFFVLIGSFMGEEEVRHYLAPVLTGTGTYSSFLLLLKKPVLKSYVDLLLDTPQFYVMFFNSVKVSVFVVLGQLLVSLPAAWAFARYDFYGKKVLFQIYLLLMILPFVVMMLPQYLVLKKIGLLDSLYAVILSGIFSAFPVFLTQYYFRKIPDSMMEAAKLDGAGEWQSFCRIGIPLSKPAIFTSVILNFLDYWGNLEQVTVFIDSQKHWTLPMFITSIKLDYAGTAFAASVFSMIPPILLILYGKEDLENGLGALSLKE